MVVQLLYGKHILWKVAVYFVWILQSVWISPWVYVIETTFTNFLTVFLQTQILVWKRKEHNPGLVACSTVNYEEEDGALWLLYASGKLRFFLRSDT